MAIKYQLYQSCQGGFYALLLKFSCKRKIVDNLTIISVKKRVIPLERAHETEKNDLFPVSLECFSQEIQSNQCDCIAHAQWFLCINTIF